jgi:hypothetical protein
VNIFYLHSNPKQAAIWHVDKHVVKMIVESAQMLFGAHRLLDERTDGYKLTHTNHPCSKWVRESSQHYDWLYELFICLCNEYTYRYGRLHLTFIKHAHDLQHAPKNLADNGWREPPQAMPSIYKVPDDSIEAYKRYYMGEKHSFAKWKAREVPDWFTFPI